MVEVEGLAYVGKTVIYPGLVHLRLELDPDKYHKLSWVAEEDVKDNPMSGRDARTERGHAAGFPAATGRRGDTGCG